MFALRSSRRACEGGTGFGMLAAMLALCLHLALAYLLGSAPAGAILAWWRAGVDLRDHGSGNVGATNAARVLGWRAGLLALAGDVLKGSAAVALVRWSPLNGFPIPVGQVELAAGAAALIGAVWPVFLRFRGGKGVATALGVLLVIDPIAALVAAATFVAVMFVTRIVSLASLAAAAALPAALWLIDGARSGPEDARATLWFSLGLLALLLWTHRDNVRRLARGEEPRFRTNGG